MPRRHKAHERQIAGGRIVTLGELAATMALAGGILGTRTRKIGAFMIILS